MWIISDKKERLPVFSKRIQTDKKIVKCLLRVSALGVFHVKINGREIEEYFMPGWTNYNKYVHICPYDITEYMQRENLIEITLADGWYAGRCGYTTKANIYGTQTALYAEIRVTYADREEERICTDESWRVNTSKIVKASFFDGEEIDYRTQSELWERLPYAKAYEYSIPFEEYDYEPTKKIDFFAPTVLFEDEGTLRLDFQQNLTGFLSLVAEGERGAEIEIRHAEMLNADGTLYYANLRSVKATDKLILSGGKDFFDPKFTFHGFRYAEITWKGRVKLSNVQAVALSQAIEYGGKFECSNEIINRIYKNALWGQKDNFISIPCDCPQRDERLGWTGDAQVFCNSAMFNGDCNRFFANYLKLIRTDVLPDGKIPSFVPFFIPVSASTAGVPGWAEAICVIPYQHYLHYGDKQVLIDNLPYAVKHLEYYLSHSENYRLRVVNPFGDWLSVVRADDIDGISQCSLGLSASLISKTYAILGDDANAEKYAEIYRGAKKAFRDEFLLDDGKIVGDSQTIYALSLAVGYVTAAEIKTPFLQSIERAGGRLTTGFIGVRHLLPALCEVGAVDLAYKIAKETEYPSWGYTIANGATTIWERWNGYTVEDGFATPSMNSFNHYSLGSCVEWFYSHVLGIKLSAEQPVCISPSLSKELCFAKGEYKSKTGKIAVEWTCEGDGYHVRVHADEGLEYSYDFKDRQVLSLQKDGNDLYAVLK